MTSVYLSFITNKHRDLLPKSAMTVSNTAEKISCYWIGQVTIKQLEKFLWLLEKCSQWSIPSMGDADKAVSLIQPQLTRPLPWILFLPTLVLLRIWRETVSLFTVLAGGERYTATRMVRYFQNKRRTLRAIKYHGIRYRRLQSQKLMDKFEKDNVDSLANLASLDKSTQQDDETFNPLEENKPKDESLNDKEATPSKKRHLSLNDEPTSGKKFEKENQLDNDQGDDEAEDDEKFNASDALRELASKVEELESELDDSDFTVDSEDLETTDYSLFEEDDDLEENVDEIKEELNADDVKPTAESEINNVEENQTINNDLKIKQDTNDETNQLNEKPNNQTDNADTSDLNMENGTMADTLEHSTEMKEKSKQIEEKDVDETEVLNNEKVQNMPSNDASKTENSKADGKLSMNNKNVLKPVGNKTQKNQKASKKSWQKAQLNQKEELNDLMINNEHDNKLIYDNKKLDDKSASFLDKERHFSNSLNVVSKKNDVAESTAKQQTNVRDRAQMRKKKIVANNKNVAIKKNCAENKSKNSSPAGC